MPGFAGSSMRRTPVSGTSEGSGPTDLVPAAKRICVDPDPFGSVSGDPMAPTVNSVVRIVVDAAPVVL